MHNRTMARVAVAMSSGVDNAVAAALRGQGHEVVGLTVNLADLRASSRQASRACCGVSAIDDARASSVYSGSATMC
jgi:tRNA U34 2-thiouridine synthase MnmA/TrmU